MLLDLWLGKLSLNDTQFEHPTKPGVPSPIAISFGTQICSAKGLRENCISPLKCLLGAAGAAKGHVPLVCGRCGKPALQISCWEGS